MKCSTCNKDIVPDEIVSGYGQDSGGNIFCYDCCAVKDKEQMLRDGNAVLYLDDVKHRVSNWPGTLKFDVKATNSAETLQRCKELLIQKDGEVSLILGVEYRNSYAT